MKEVLNICCINGSCVRYREAEARTQLKKGASVVQVVLSLIEKTFWSVLELLCRTLMSLRQSKNDPVYKFKFKSKCSTPIQSL